MATTVQYGLKSVQKVIKFPSRTENQKLILKSRSEFSSYLLGDQTPIAVSRALWYYRVGLDNLYTCLFMNFAKYFYWERLLPVAVDCFGY